MDLPPNIRGVIDALTAQRNREADAVAELNGRCAALQAEVYALRARCAQLETAMPDAARRAMDAAAELAAGMAGDA